MTARFHECGAYAKLTADAAKMRGTHLRKLFVEQPDRAARLSIGNEHLFFDFSRQLLNPETLTALFDLAGERGLKGRIEAMFQGEKINRTEGRSVLHVALRDPAAHPEVDQVLKQVAKYSQDILTGRRTGLSGQRLKNIVSIGIGGSYLGPEYLATALKPYAEREMKLIFVANVDGTDFAEKTAGLNPEETLVIVVSKTFTTAETMKNAATAKQWILGHYDNKPEAISRHFAAVSTAADKVAAFGIDPANMFGFWDWVGGRFSATSAVGALPLSLYLGSDNFQKVLEGARWLDRHFLTAPLEQNLPVLSGLIDIWNINFLGYQTRALLPYSQGLAKLAVHTQQVEMESNGKSVDLEGRPVAWSTGEVVFGEPGTNGQHSFYQLIHQGTEIIPCDFIGFLRPQYQVGQDTAKEVSHHRELMTNFLAQPDALAFGQESADPARNFPGNRPSSSLLLEELNPFTAGLLLAWTEHRAAVKGFIWGINSFDQFGVELGKVLGVDQRKRMLSFNADGQVDTTGLNPSTARLLRAILEQKLPDQL